MALGDVVDELHDNHGLTHAGTTEGTHFTTLGEGADKIDNLDAGFEDLSGRVLIDERRSRAMNAVALSGLRCGLVIHGVASDVENTTKNFFAHGHGDRAAGIGHIATALETFSAGHSHGTDPTVAKMALHFADETNGLAAQFVADFQCVIDLGQLAARGEIHVHHGTDDLDDFADVAHMK